MITIDARTKETRNTREHQPQVFSDIFPRMNITPGYIRGWCKPNFPVPAIRFTEELVHSEDGERVHFLLMYQHPDPNKIGYVKVVGDSPNMKI